MDKLITLEPSNIITIRIEPAQKCYGILTLRNVMYTMPVAFHLQATNRTRYTIVPNLGILSPLTTITLEITYHLPSNCTFPDRFPRCDDSFILQSVVAPGAVLKNKSDSVPTEWFTNKKKQVYSDSGIKVLFVGSRILAHLMTRGYMDEIREVLEKSDPSWKSVDSVDSEGRSLLHLAISQGRPDFVQLLLEFEPEIEAVHSHSGSTPLEVASALGEELIVELLLSHKANTERSESSALGPIHLAAGNGHVDVLKHLLLKGANVNALTKDGRTALHLAVEEKRRDCTRILLANYARPDIGNTIDGNTPLHIAANIGDESIVKLLINKGANKDIRNKAGKTAYDLAAENGHTKLFDSLRLADSLCGASRKGDLRLILQLLENGAEITGRDKNGWNALHRASFKGWVDVVKTLIEKSIDINAKDEEGYTALHCAVESGQTDVIEVLIKKGADIEAKTNKGLSAMQIAEYWNYSGIARILVQVGGAKDGLPKVRKQSSMEYSKGSFGKDMNVGVVQKKHSHSVRVQRTSFDRIVGLAVV